MDMLLTTFRLAVRALWAYKTRSVLTMLGLIIGIGAVIVMISVGRGANAKIQQQISSLGSNMLMVFNGSSRAGGVSGGRGSNISLRVSDAEAISRECPAIMATTYVIRRNVQLIYGNTNWGTSLDGTTPEYTTVRNWSVAQGDFFDQSHMKSAASVIVLGASVAEALFQPGEQIIGQTIRVQNFPFKVIGVLAAKGQSAMGSDQDDAVYVPYPTAIRRLSGKRWPGLVHFIGVSALTKDLVPEAQREIEELLRQRHKINPGMDDDFKIRTQDEIAQQQEQAGSTMTLLLTAVAAVSLLVGGIGIMNIMLVSVTERTREIGVRMAVGAREYDVLVQFLVESVTMSVAGGVMGTIAGVGISNIISHYAGWPTIITPGSIVLASFFSGAVGVFFGFYPAFKASRLNPIEALRYE